MNYNYELKCIELENKSKFYYFAFEEKTGLLTNFFSGEVINCCSTIKDQIEQVLSKKKRHVECSGNECYWNIGSKETLIVDNFANEGEPSEITVNTQELRRLIDEWIAARDKFREQKTKGEI